MKIDRKQLRAMWSYRATRNFEEDAQTSKVMAKHGLAALDALDEAVALLEDAEFGGDDSEEAGAWDLRRTELLARLDDAGAGEKP